MISDAEANRNLTALVSRGGSFWVGLSTTTPDTALSPGSITDAGLPLAQLPLNGATTWAAASSRTVQPKAALQLGTAPADVVPVAIILYTDQAGTTPARAAMLGNTLVTAGSTVTVPPEALAIVVPANGTY